MLYDYKYLLIATLTKQGKDIIHISMKRVKSGKAVGPDGMSVEE